MDLAARLADALRHLRRQAGLSQGEMARALGISRPTVNRLESASQNVTLVTLNKLVRALKCEPGDLFKVGSLRLPAGRRLARKD